MANVKLIAKKVLRSNKDRNHTSQNVSISEEIEDSEVTDFPNTPDSKSTEVTSMNVENNFQAF